MHADPCPCMREHLSSGVAEGSTNVVAAHTSALHAVQCMPCMQTGTRVCSCSRDQAHDDDAKETRGNTRTNTPEHTHAHTGTCAGHARTHAHACTNTPKHTKTHARACAERGLELRAQALSHSPTAPA